MQRKAIARCRACILHHAVMGGGCREVRHAVILEHLHEAIRVEALGKQLGAKVEAETRVDESLIGGFVVRVGSRQFDASVKAKLDALRLALKSA